MIKIPILTQKCYSLTEQAEIFIFYCQCSIKDYLSTLQGTSKEFYTYINTSQQNFTNLKEHGRKRDSTSTISLPKLIKYTLAEASQAPDTNVLMSGAKDRLITSPVCPK